MQSFIKIVMYNYNSQIRTRYLIKTPNGITMKNLRRMKSTNYCHLLPFLILKGTNITEEQKPITLIIQITYYSRGKTCLRYIRCKNRLSPQQTQFILRRI